MRLNIQIIIQCILLILITCAAACAPVKEAPPTKKIILFDHETEKLTHWKLVGKGGFMIKNHQLQSNGGMGLLYYTKQKFANARIHIVYKVNYPDTNSGIFVRIAKQPKDAWYAVHHGYEIQICDSGKDAFDPFHMTGAVYTFSKATHLVSKPSGMWNVMNIILNKKHIVVFINGIKVSDYTTGDPSPKRGRYSDPKHYSRPISGYIGVQNHDHDATHSDSHVSFKEISVTPL